MCYLEQGQPEPIGNAALVSLAGTDALITAAFLDIIGNPKLPTATAQAFAAALPVPPAVIHICSNLDGAACMQDGPCPQ
jgi:hypothetical protein